MGKASFEILVCFLITTTIPGCIVLPMPSYYNTRSCAKEFREDYVYADNLAFMTPGSTTKDVVLQKLGKPDIIREETDTFGYYQWIETVGEMNWNFIVAGGYSGAAGKLGSSYMKRVCLLLVEFSHDDVLERYLVKGIWVEDLYEEKEWIQIRELPDFYIDKPHIREKHPPPNTLR